MPTQRTIDNHRIRAHYGHNDGTRKVRIVNDGSVHYSGHRDGLIRDNDHLWLYAGKRSEVLREIRELEGLDYCPQCGVEGEVVVNRMGCSECGASW
tara:strand:+ start:1740 stop:2027 length:288 start_codon:yes stop_codon:yes gene_type:complete